MNAVEAKEGSVEELVQNFEKVWKLPNRNDVIEAVFAKEFLASPFPEYLCTRIRGLKSNHQYLAFVYVEKRSTLLKQKDVDLDKVKSLEALYADSEKRYKILEVADNLISKIEKK